MQQQWPYLIDEFHWNESRKAWLSLDDAHMINPNHWQKRQPSFSATYYTFYPPIAFDYFQSKQEVIKHMTTPDVCVRPLRYKTKMGGRATRCGKLYFWPPKYHAGRGWRLDLYPHSWQRNDGRWYPLEKMPSYSQFTDWLLRHQLTELDLTLKELSARLELAVNMEAPDQILIDIYEEYRSVRQDKNVFWEN